MADEPHKVEVHNALRVEITGTGRKLWEGTKPAWRIAEERQELHNQQEAHRGTE